MDKKRVKQYIDIWLNNIKLEGIDELENIIGTSISDFIVDILDNLYNQYSAFIENIPKEMDCYNNYVISFQKGTYSLEDFLLNRLLRSVNSIIYSDQSHTFNPDSHYDHDYCEILIDKDRIENQLSDIRQRRKLVTHEFLHAIKTQFYDGFFFEDERYEKMKKELRNVFGSDINSFSLSSHDEIVISSYKHCGLGYSSRLIKKNTELDIDLTNLDEIFNDSDAIEISNDDSKGIYSLSDNCLMIINNIESSNAFITNYAFILKRIIDKRVLFNGLYFEPMELYQWFNSTYTTIFQKHFNSSKTALEILAEQLKRIKKDPYNIDQHVMLLNALYDCIEKYYIMTDFDSVHRRKSIGCIGNKGLLEIVNGRLQPLRNLPYCDEYNANRNKKK